MQLLAKNMLHGPDYLWQYGTIHVWEKKKFKQKQEEHFNHVCEKYKCNTYVCMKCNGFR